MFSRGSSLESCGESRDADDRYCSMNGEKAKDTDGWFFSLATTKVKKTLNTPLEMTLETTRTSHCIQWSFLAFNLMRQTSHGGCCRILGKAQLK